MPTGTLERLAAFTTTPAGGNPAGVWIGDALPDPAEMQRIAAEVGYSETAFLAPAGPAPGGDGHSDFVVRYYSPAMEVAFCGHATIASGVALGWRRGDRTFRLRTTVGEVPVDVETVDGRTTATLTSVAPAQRNLSPALLDACLGTLGWTRADLDPLLPPGVAFAGAWHLSLPLATRATLASLDYDFDALRRSMREEDLTTVQIVWRDAPDHFFARNPFPVGGVVEDPATGAAAAALGGYLRHHGLVDPPADIVVQQGDDMGRPSTIHVHIPADGGIRVSGTAVTIPG
jgi:PhzF family phenazine biosynthesis protein